MVRWVLLLACFLRLGGMLPDVLAQETPAETGIEAFINALQSIEPGENIKRVSPVRVFSGRDLDNELKFENPVIAEFKPSQQVTQQFGYGSAGQTMELKAWYFKQSLDAFGAFSAVYPETSINSPLAVYQPLPSLFAYWESPVRQQLWYGNMLLILDSDVAEPEMAQAYGQLIEALLPHFSETGKMPQVLMILPTRGLLLESLHWRIEPDFTPENTGKVLSGVYGRNRPGNVVETECHFVIVQYDTPAIAAEEFNTAWRNDFFAQDNPRSLSSIGQNSFYLYSKKFGLVAVMQQGRFIVALRHVVDLQRGEAFLRIIAREIRRLPLAP